jgi:hypothetical protein
MKRILLFLTLGFSIAGFSQGKFQLGVNLDDDGLL